MPPRRITNTQSLSQSPYDKSPDLWERKLPPKKEPDIYYSIGTRISRGILGLAVNVTTTPGLILTAQDTRTYMFLNPARSVGLTNSVVVVPSLTTSAAGNSQVSSIGVSGFISMHLYLNIASITGTWDFFAQVFDPISSIWMDAQTIDSGITTAGSYYYNLGSFGIATDFAVRWVPTAAGTITFTMNGTLKDGIGGSNAGVAQTVFLGGSDVTTVSGYPILEGQKEIFIIDEGVTIYGVTTSALTLRIFQL